MPKKLTREEFIAKAKQAHGDKYSYEKADYKNSRTKVCIICPEHGEFWQSPFSHIKGYGCNMCLIDKKRKQHDLTGQRFGKLVVIGLAGVIEHTGRKNSLWFCHCDCGRDVTLPRLSLTHTKHGRRSCGCITHQLLQQANLRHGQASTKLYRKWASMIDRCSRPNSQRWSQYGGRGIEVCDEWKDFRNFSQWAHSNGFDPNAEFGVCTLDRIDVNGNYCPENCRWVDAKTQANNRRNNSVVYVGKHKITATEFCRLIDIPEHSFLFRLRKGLDVNFILETSKKFKSGKIHRRDGSINYNRVLSDYWICKLNLQHIIHSCKDIIG